MDRACPPPRFGSAAPRRGPHTPRITLAAIIALIAASLPQAPAQAAQPAQPAQNAAPRPAQIDRNGTLILIRSSILALQHANETGNYTVLRDLGAPGFQAANTATRLGEIFSSLRAQRLDLSGVTVLDPQLTILPQIESNGLLHMAGFFPSVPTQINFELLYAPVDGRWRLFGMSVKLGSSAPVAPSPPPVAASATAKPEAKADPSKVKHKPRRKKPTEDDTQ